MDNWTAFQDRLRTRYQNTELREKLVEQRQSLKQHGNTVQLYKQRFEHLCLQTELPKAVWGDEFYKGLVPAIKDRLSSVAYLDRRIYDLLTHHAIKFDESYHARQHEKAIEKQFKDNIRITPTINTHQSLFTPSPSQTPSQLAQPTAVDINGKLTQTAKEYRRLNNLCLYDGGQHKTHLCPKLIEKCIKEGKPLPVDPATRVSKPDQ